MAKTRGEWKTRAQRKAKHNVPPEFELEDDGPEISLDCRTTHLCNLVFSNELLREIIIDFVISDPHDIEEFSKENALSCRLVQKSWMESVFKCVVKSGKTLVNIGLHGHSIRSFLKIYKPSSLLPFKLKTWFITGAVERDLEKCLNFCNNGLVELELQRWSSRYKKDSYPKFKPTNGLLRQTFTLPKLRKLKYSVERSSILPDTTKENKGIDIHFVPQSILSGAFNLKYFEFSFANRLYCSKTLPATVASFGNLLLPGTIEKLVLDCQLETDHLEPLLKNNMLSNLTDLTVVMPNVRYGDSDWLFRVLNRVCYTLKTLTIDGSASWRGEEGITTVDPPVMKYLKRMLISTVNFEWADGITDLHLKLPALEKLDLQFVRSCSLKKWLDNNFKYDLLTELKIQFYDIEQTPEWSLLTIDSSQLMSTAFPKLTKLEIFTPCVDTTDKALQCFFQNMTQLRVLTLELCAIKGYVLPPRYLDALLLGISCEVIDTLKSSECARAKLWETVQLNVDEQQSVVNLSQLMELNINWPAADMFVSDKVEAFVVSKMPNLQKTELLRPYKFSREETLKYTENGQIFNWE